MNNELLEYKQFEDEIRDDLEAQYDLCMLNKDLEAAYNTLGKLMEYKLIDKDDPRIDSKNKAFKSAGIDKNHRFRYDYRNANQYMPTWLYGKLGFSRIIECNTISHWGKRVEGKYEGDVIFKSIKLKIRMSLCNNPGAADSIGYALDKELNANGTLRELVNAGVYRVYSVDFYDCHFTNKNIGYVVVRMTDNGAEGTFFSDYDSLVNNWVPVKDAIMGIGMHMQELIGGPVTLGIPWDAALTAQAKKLEQDKWTGERVKRELAEQAAADAREKAAKEAAKAAAKAEQAARKVKKTKKTEDKAS